MSKALPLVLLTNLLSNEGLEALRFSRNQRQRCQVLRKWQEINDGNAFRTLSESDRLTLHKDLEDDLPALILELPEIDQIIWLKRWRNLNDPLFHPCCPVDGQTLKNSLDLPSGPLLGRLMSYLCHERAFGRLNNQQQVFEVARYWLKQNQTLL